MGIYPTFLAGIFRSVRFGAEEAHGIANMISFNYILEHGGFEYIGETEKFRVNNKKVRDAVSSLLNKLLTIEATGDYESAVKLIEHYGEMPDNMKTVIAKLCSRVDFDDNLSFGLHFRQLFELHAPEVDGIVQRIHVGQRERDRFCCGALAARHST